MKIENQSTAGRLNQGDKQADTSLRGKALQRAMGAAVPKTLTPYEWEQWYAENGIPESHRAPACREDRPWWRFWESGS